MGWELIRMAPVVDDVTLPNERDLAPQEFPFPVVLDFSVSLMDEHGVRGLIGLVRRAVREQRPLRLRLREESQIHLSLRRKCIDRLFFQPVVEPSGPLPTGVVEWQLAPHAAGKAQ